MSKWNNPEIEELNLTETQHGDKPEFPLDGDRTDKGLPYGANTGKES